MREKHQDSELIEKNADEIETLLEEIKEKFKVNEKFLVDTKKIWFDGLSQQQDVNDTQSKIFKKIEQISLLEIDISKLIDLIQVNVEKNLMDEDENNFVFNHEMVIQ